MCCPNCRANVEPKKQPRLKYCIYDKEFDAFHNGNTPFCQNPWIEFRRDPADNPDDTVKTWCLKHSLGGLTSEDYGFAVEVSQDIVSTMPFVVTPTMIAITPNIKMADIWDNGTALCFIKDGVCVHLLYY